MTRFRKYSSLDTPWVTDTDQGFLGVDMRRDQRQLEPGLCHKAINFDFSLGHADPRRGISTVGWAKRETMDFPMDFWSSDWAYDYAVFTSDVASIATLNYRVYNGTTWQFRDPVTDLWHSIWIEPSGAEFLIAVDPVGMSDWVYAAFDGANANFRLLDDKTFQLYCPVTALFHTVFVQKVGSAYALAIDPDGMTAAETGTEPASENHRVFDATTFQLGGPGLPLWFALYITNVGGQTVLAMDSGMEEEGIDFDDDTGFGTIYGELRFSDPYGQEAGLLATSKGMFRIQQWAEPQLIDLPPDVQFTSECRMVQAFDRVLLFNNVDLDAPILWNPEPNFGTGFGAFEYITPSATRGDDPDNTYGDGTKTIPNESDAVAFGNRIIVLTGRDELVVSDVLDPTRYNKVTQQFRVQAGSDDKLVRVLRWNKTTAVLAKDQSMHAMYDFHGNLSQSKIGLITDQYGVCGRDAIAKLGKDVWFMVRGRGVYSLIQALDSEIQADTEPLSAPVHPLIRRINWTHGDNIQFGYHRDKLFIAAPLDGAAYNNAIIVMDFQNRRWAGHWQADFLDVRGFIQLDYAGEKRLFAVQGDTNTFSNAAGAVLLMEEGYDDYLHGISYDIAHTVSLRGYSLGVQPFKDFRTLILDLATWKPNVTVTATTEGVNEVKILTQNETKSTTRYHQFGVADWDPRNIADDHGDPYREDYSVTLGAAGQMYLGSGVDLQLHQEAQYGYKVDVRGAYCYPTISCSQGRCSVRAATVEAAALGNPYRTKV